MELPTKEQFEAYESVRQSGAYNMFDERARELSGLNKKDYISVMKNYSELCKLYPDVRN